MGLAPTGKRRLFTAHATSGTHAPQQRQLYSITSSAMASNVGGSVRPSNLRRREIDDQLELRRLYHWQIGGLGALENARGINGPLPVGIRNAGSIAHERAGFRGLTK